MIRGSLSAVLGAAADARGRPGIKSVIVSLCVCVCVCEKRKRIPIDLETAEQNRREERKTKLNMMRREGQRNVAFLSGLALALALALNTGI